MIISFGQLQVFLYILARVMGLFLQAPVLSSRSFPAPAKTAIAVWITILLWFVVPVNTGLLPSTFLGFMMLLVMETTIGFVMGFACNAIFIAIQSAGELMDMQMGLSVSQAFDPIFGASISVVGRLFFFISMVTFLIFNGHHLLLSLLHQSFRILPPPAVINLANPAFAMSMLALGPLLLRTALQLAAAIILLIFLSDFCFGIVSRVAPQVNVFMLGFQVKPALGLAAILITLPNIIDKISGMLGTIGEEVLKLLMALKV